MILEGLAPSESTAGPLVTLIRAYPRRDGGAAAPCRQSNTHGAAARSGGKETIVRVTHVHSSLVAPLGGAEAYVMTLASAQAARGHSVRIVCGAADAQTVAAAAAAGVTVDVRPVWRPYPADRHGARVIGRLLFHALDLVGALATPAAYRHVQRSSDVVHVHRFQGIGARVLRSRHSAVVHTTHDYGLVDTRSTTVRDGRWPDRLEWVQRRRAALLWRCARRADVIVFPSERTRARHLELGFPVDETLLHVVPHGWPRPAGRDRTRRRSRPRFVFLGKLEGVKGIHLLLRAWELAAIDGELVIAGDGPERGRVEAAAGRTVTYAGWVDGHDKTALIASATALVFPSLWPETFGLVIAESMLLGRPVVATHAAAGSLVRDGENGVVSADTTPAAFAAALQRIAEDSALRRTLARGAAATARELDFALHVSRIDEEYRVARETFAAAGPVGSR